MTIVALEIGSPRTSKEQAAKDRYADTSVGDVIKERSGWLVFFFGGLLIAAFVVEIFETVLKEHVELSYFVPLLIGHGGNTGAQSNATIIRSEPLKHLPIPIPIPIPIYTSLVPLHSATAPCNHSKIHQLTFCWRFFLFPGH